MSHENSQTLKGMFQNRDGTREMRWYNAYGNDSNRFLEKLHPFEKYSYDTEKEAVEAAKLRSNLHHFKNPFGAPYFSNMPNGEGFLGDKPIDMSLAPKSKSVWGKIFDWAVGNKTNQGRFPGGGSY